MQRSHGRILQSLLLAGAGALLASEANAELTFVGNAPTGTTTVLQRAEMRGATGVLKFKFTAGTPGTAPSFTMGFCFQDPNNITAAACGAAGEYVVTVYGGASALAVVPASILNTHQLVVVNPTSSVIPFEVDID